MHIDTIERSTLINFMVCTLLSLGLFRFCVFSNTIFKSYSLLILAVSVFCVSIHKKRIGRNFWGLALAVVIAISVVHSDQSMTGIMNALVYLFQFAAPFVVLDYLIEKFGYVDTLKCMLAVTAVICAIMDFSVIFSIDVDKTYYQNLVTYLFGNKFMVAYLHMQLMGFYAAYRNIKDHRLFVKVKLYIFLFAVYSVILCKHVHCATGMIGNLAIMCMLLVPFNKSLKKILADPFTMMSLLLVASVLILTSDKIVQLPLFKMIIVNVLHKDVTLTGRYRIYRMIPDLVREHKYLGYGMNNNIVTQLIGYGNAQHGVLQYVLDCGIIGAVLFLITWASSLRKGKKRLFSAWPIICMVYGFMVASLVEVCFKLSFFLALAMLSGLSVARDLDEKE